MISKKQFILICSVFAIGLGYNFFHTVLHHHDAVVDLVDAATTASDLTEAITTEEQDVTDTHTHEYYYSGVKGTNKLVKTYDKSFGEPNDAKPHRHKGNDYFLYGTVTWKHVHDQHKAKENK